MIRNSIAFLATLYGSLMVALPVAHADKLSDFKEAAAKDGCDAIPYSDMQSNCRSSMKDVGMWCDGYKGPVRCDIALTESLLAQIDTEQKNIAAAQERRKELVDKRDRAVGSQKKAELAAEIEAIDKGIEASTKIIDEAKVALNKQKYAAQTTIDTITKCTEARAAIAKTAFDARDKAGGESDPDIKDYANTIRGKLAGFKTQQDSAVEKLTNSLKLCKKSSP